VPTVGLVANKSTPNQFSLSRDPRDSSSVVPTVGLVANKSTPNQFSLSRDPRDSSSGVNDSVAPMMLGKMDLFVVTVCGKTITLNISTSASVDDLINFIYAKEGIVPDKQLLKFEGKQLEIGHALAHYNVQDNETIRMLPRLQGGMENLGTGYYLRSKRVIPPPNTKVTVSKRSKPDKSIVALDQNTSDDLGLEHVSVPAKPKVKKRQKPHSEITQRSSKIKAIQHTRNELNIGLYSLTSTTLDIPYSENFGNTRVYWKLLPITR